MSGPDRGADGGREFRRSFAARLVFAVLGLLATLGTSVVAVRVLDTADAAAFLAILAALMLGPMLGRLGLGPHLIRTVAAARSEREIAQAVTSHLVAVLLLSVLTAPLVAFLATPAVREGRGAVVLLVVVLVVAESLRLTVSDVYAAVGRVGWAVLGTHHVRALCSLLVVLVVVVSADDVDLIAVLLTYTGASVVLLAVSLVRLPVRGHGARIGRLTGLFAIVLAGSQFFALELGAFLVGRADVWVAGFSFSARDALLYSAASVLAMQVAFVEGLANIALTPVAARLWAAGKRDRVVALLSASSTLTTTVTVFGVGVVALAAPWLLRLYGDGLEDAAALLTILAVGALGMAAFGGCAVLLVASGNGRAAALSVVSVLVVMVPVVAVATWWGGPAGLAATSASATIALFASYTVACRRAVGRVPLPTFRVVHSIRVIRGGLTADEDAAAAPAAGAVGAKAEGTVSR
ncbi:lipopolysaccharide biosynthesis protein [Klenkia taihuensis]|uniref:Membrane protein involved in the export of O-antigen and teichoic acid n=1 Tax=Klenkia taihuensis TaxID=1225127 RepID=A0A1I1NQL2_9ACTN|nr:hypothetical protein [Klenkia taihuensis]GHE11789.1 hypothetical protein GCM10011381_26760 [Klenkia taihuensis]SFC99572.1 Membrane protein involved in the export of O-antigen and teichoic acid [Klenkia taihuensis]